jgi:hypothetical protein
MAPRHMKKSMKKKNILDATSNLTAINGGNSHRRPKGENHYMNIK